MSHKLGIAHIKEKNAEGYYVVHDVLPLYHHGRYHKNSVNTEETVAEHLLNFCKDEGLDPGNLYIVEFSEGGYYLACDGFNYNGNDPSEEFWEYCDHQGLDLDGRKHNPTGEWK